MDDKRNAQAPPGQPKPPEALSRDYWRLVGGLIGAVKGGVKGINPTVVAAVLADGANAIEVSAWAKEGLIAQLAATKVIEGLAASYRQG